MASRVPLEDAVGLVDNPECRCPCLLQLDMSESMEGDGIAALMAVSRLFAMNSSRTMWPRAGLRWQSLHSTVKSGSVGSHSPMTVKVVGSN